MAGARLEPVPKNPGIFKRQGDRGIRYVLIYRDSSGKQRQETATTLKAAQEIKRRRDLGDTHAAGRLTFAVYARDWVTRHPARDSTRADYKAHLEAWIVPFLGEKRRLAEVTPLLVRQLVDHLQAAKGKRTGKPLAHTTVQTILTPLRACLGQAVRDGLIQHNPTRDIKVQKPAEIDDDDEQDVRAFTPEQLATVLAVMPERHRLLFRFLAGTGLRVSELFAVQWRHLALDGDSPHVRVRRAFYRGQYHPPKTKHGRRDVPLPHSLVVELREWRKATEWPRDTDIVFPSMVGTPLNYGTFRHRVLVPAVQEAGVSWAGFHTFRHTVASTLFAQGRNAKQVQRWLGHHSAAFTLEVYVHLLSDELDAPLELPIGAEGASKFPAGHAETSRSTVGAEALECVK